MKGSGDVELTDRPKLRPVEAFPVEAGGKKGIALRDPAGFTDAVLVLPPPLVDIVSLFDGEHSLLEIQEIFMRRHGRLLFKERLEEISRTLDEHGFLDSETFSRRRATIETRFRASPTRPAVQAGSAYAAEPEALSAQVAGFFAHPEGPGPAPETPRAGSVNAIMAPHIDFHRGGPVYAWAYRELAERSDADLFVILGTCHAGMPDPFALTLKDYETPLGPAAVDRDFAAALRRRYGDDLLASEVAHRSEHSIEFQAVFLRGVFGARREFAVVPILASFLHENLIAGTAPEADPRIPRFFDALGETIAASPRKVCLIAGVDLAHVGPRFGDPEPVGRASLAHLEREDRSMLEAVAAVNPPAFYESVAKDGDSRRICGLSPIYTLLRCLPAGEGRLLRYAQWPDPQGVVTFASLVFYSEGPVIATRDLSQRP
ncbi:MAG: AmmeMemoRadiSam system protein B [Candidatus Rokubacteria bacterium]|nr:AmmeMemoRadiSam system protein B [Candidatus Rokubacteria bacterium]